MRYVMRHANRESSKLWTQLALLRKYVCWSVCSSPPPNLVFDWSRPHPLPFWEELRAQMNSLFNRDDQLYHEPRFLCYFALGTTRRQCKNWKRVGTFCKGAERNFGDAWSYPCRFCGTTSIGPPIRQDYPPNLSILLSGGKETNKDSLSKGDWSGKSPCVKPSGVVTCVPLGVPGVNLLEQSIREGDNPVRHSESPIVGRVSESSCLGL